MRLLLVCVQCTVQSETVVGVCTVHSAQCRVRLLLVRVQLYSAQCRVRLLLVCVQCTVQSEIVIGVCTVHSAE